MTEQKLLRVLQLDASDARIFDPVALPGEWAVPGSFHFWDADLEQLTGAERQAFANGFLGIGSFGRTTLVTVAEIDPVEYARATRLLAEHLVARFGAPDTAAALPVAREEMAFSQSLCSHPVGSVIAVSRSFDGQEFSEDFRRWNPPSEVDHTRLRIFGTDDTQP
ncbi:MAG: hypothetical protein EA347_10255 [Thioalkalivibrio sp.]|nr:MAG: hypothetical protein EA347_10255 [Thioalkalivibrio sp.]